LAKYRNIPSWQITTSCIHEQSVPLPQYCGICQDVANSTL
jgi:hypothetical protein